MKSGSFFWQRLWYIVGATCLASAIALGAFAYWGLYTDAGIHAYDEMDALYPFAAGALGVLLLIPAVVALWLAQRVGRSG